MARLDEVDLYWSYDGDFGVGKDGDLLDTSDDLIQAKVQEIQSIVKSEIGDWKYHPNFAATLSDFVGKPNSRTTGTDIRDRIISVLVSNNVLSAGDFDVRVVPVDIHSVLVMIKVFAMATERNSLEQGQPIVVSLVYDTNEGSALYLPESQIERNYFF